MASIRRSSIIDLETNYPPIDHHFNKYKLPTYLEIIGLVKKFNQTKTYNNAIIHVANMVWKHWIDLNIYPISLKYVKNQIRREVDGYKRLKKLIILREVKSGKKSRMLHSEEGRLIQYIL